MGLDIFLLIVGFILIAKGGDMFVDSSVHIGRALNYSPLYRWWHIGESCNDDP